MYISDQETAVDYLYYEAISKTVVKLIRENADHPLSIGIHGDWGAGKSSVLKMVQGSTEGQEGVLCLWFNGWLFQGFEDAKIVLLESIVNELAKRNPKAGKKAVSLLQRINWMKIARKSAPALIGGIISLITHNPLPILSGLVNSVQSPEKAGESLGKAAVEEGKVIEKGAKSVTEKQIDETLTTASSFINPAEVHQVTKDMHEFHREFKELLVDAEVMQLIVLIDDLDRCLPETAIQTLEAIRLFLFVPKTSFVIAADEGMIEYAVKKHFPDLQANVGSSVYARNYLEKLIQVPFRIPALGPSETRTYITLILLQHFYKNKKEEAKEFEAIIAKAREFLQKPWENSGLDTAAVQAALQKNIPAEMQPLLALSEQTSTLLTEGTKGNPRQIKRFINSMLLRREVAEARGFMEIIKMPEMAKLMLAEAFAQQHYNQFVDLSFRTEGGKIEALEVFEAIVREEEADPAKKEVNSGLIDGWQEQEWLVNWAKLSPKLGQEDLRPYFFIARDKKVYLSASANLGHLQNIYNELVGPAILIPRIEPELTKLGRKDAEQLFVAITQELSSKDLRVAPPDGTIVTGLIALVKAQPHLQDALLSFLRNLPTSKLGPWITKGWNACLVSPEAQQSFRDILTSWQDQTDSEVLSRVASGALRVLDGGTT